MAKGQGRAGADIRIGRAMPAEYPAILNNLPPEWFEPSPHLLHLQVADMINGNRFLIAYVGQTLVGTLGWQENIAFGAYYAKFAFVKPEYRRDGVAIRLFRELLEIARDNGQRALFADAPRESPVVRAVNQIPGAREVGSIQNFHGDGLESVIFSLDVDEGDGLIELADRLTSKPGGRRELPDYLLGS